MSNFISLVPYDFSSESSDSETDSEQEKVPTKKIASEEQMSKKDVENEEDKTSSTQKQVLPSVSDAFSSIDVPKYIRRVKTEDDDVLQYFNNTKPEKKRESKYERLRREQMEKERDEKEKKEKAEREEKERLQRVQEENAIRDEMYKLKREGREKIKEKMKRQRLNGQSGIGENFRHWRSDAEMVMRQQYQ